MIFKKRAQDERGLALITVVVAATVLMLLATTLVASAYSSSNISRHDQDWNAALAGAEAGIDDYVFRLNENSNYWVYNASNPPPVSRPERRVHVLGRRRRRIGVVAVPLQRRRFLARRRRPHQDHVERPGGDTERTVYATLRRRSFLDFLYFTDIRDP